MLEDGEELIGPGIHLVTAGAAHRCRMRRRVSASTGAYPSPRRCTNPVESWMSVSRNVTAPEGRAALTLAPQLAVHEADRHDPVLLGGPQQPPPGAVAGLVVLELHLVESGQGVANVRFVVNRQAPATVRIDVREVAVAQHPALSGAESLWSRQDAYRSRWVAS